MKKSNSSPTAIDSLHIFTYDVRGTIVATGKEKPSRQTGLVTQTHQLLQGIIDARPNIKLAVTQTGAKEVFRYDLRIPEGKLVYAQGIISDFKEYLANSLTGGKDKKKVAYYYEKKINDRANPIYDSLARQYAEAVYSADMQHLIMQNPNPLVSLLKAEELRYLDDITLQTLNVVGVIHDVEGYKERIEYIKQRLLRTKMRLQLIAISSFVRNALVDAGIDPSCISVVPNGLDVEIFKQLFSEARKQKIFEQIALRNNLPAQKKMVLVSARRVEHKGHLDVIEAVKILKQQHMADGFYVAFTGKNMLNTQALHFESKLQEAIKKAGLERDIFLLDPLSSLEVAACFDSATLSILASTEPEGFAYSNIESMIAGAPVITTQLGGPLDYITHKKTGLFVRPHAPKDIAEAIKQIMEDSQLYAAIVHQAKEKAEAYGLDRMAHGYLKAVEKGAWDRSVPILRRRGMEKIGEGMHTEVYGYVPDNGIVLQTLKKEHGLTVETLTSEYEYLRYAYKHLPLLIPVQRIVARKKVGLVEDTLIIKERVYPNPSLKLLECDADELSVEALHQLEEFVFTTRELIVKGVDDPLLRSLGSRAPDIIDPLLDNLIIDCNNNLRLVDTNKTISTRHLVELVSNGRKLDIEVKKIHALLLKRMIYLEKKFLGKKDEDIMSDSFYIQYLDTHTLGKMCKETVASQISLRIKRTTTKRSYA